MPKAPSRILVILAFFSVYFIWGTTYLAAAFALKGFPPFLLAMFRYAIAGILLTVYAASRGLRFPAGKELRVLSISGILMLVGGSGLVIFAQLYIVSGYAAAIIATEPLWFILFDRKRWKVYFGNPWILFGLVVGFAGVACFSFLAPAENAAASQHWIGTTILVLASILWVVGTLYASSSFSEGTSNTTGSAVQLFAAAAVSLLIGSFRGEWAGFDLGEISAAAWSGLAYLVIMGSLVAFLAYNWLVKVQPPAIVSTHTFVNPVVAIFMGWLVAHEKVSFAQLMALLAVLVGVVIIQLKKPRGLAH